MMQKLLVFCFAVGLMLSPAFATNVYYVPDSVTDTWTEQYENQSTDITSTNTNPGGGAYTQFTGSTTATSGWWSIGIGHEYIWDVDCLDLTGYDEIRITITNENQAGGDKLWARAFANAGWVPSPGDQRLEGSELWIDPGASFTSIIDISVLDATRKSQFTKIGIDVGMYADQQTWDLDGSCTGTGFDETVVPEPTTIALLGLGVLGLLRKKNK